MTKSLFSVPCKFHFELLTCSLKFSLWCASCFRDCSLPGGYRAIVIRPTDMEWKMFRYDDTTASLALSDIDYMNGVEEPQSIAGRCLFFFSHHGCLFNLCDFFVLVCWGFWCCCSWWWWWLFPRVWGFWENVWQFIPRLRFFFFFFPGED